MNIHLAAFCSRTLFIYNPKHQTICSTPLLLGGRTSSSGNPWCTLGFGTGSSVCG